MYIPISKLTPEQAEKRRARQREYYRRQKEKHRALTDRWDKFFSTGELVPIDEWMKIYEVVMDTVLILDEAHDLDRRRNVFLEKFNPRDGISARYCVKTVNFQYFSTEKAARKKYEEILKNNNLSDRRKSQHD